MKILVVCQYYWPEQFQITDICEELASLGHDVTVLTGLPNVNLEGSPNIIPPEYRDKSNWNQVHNGVNIVRCHEVSRKTGVINRMRNYYSFWKSSVRRVPKLDSDFDVVFAYQLSPGMMAEAATEYSKRFGAPIVLYCCDLWPESLKAWLGNRFRSIVAYYGRICGRIYRSADALLVQSPAFTEYLINYHGVCANKIKYLPQFSTDDQSSKNMQEAHGGFNVLFLGNMGSVQGIGCMLEAACLTRSLEGICWHFVGDGEMLEEAKRYVDDHGLRETVVFHGRRAKTEMEAFYRMADVCVLALDDSSLIGATIPSKLQGYMAAGKPVIGAVGGGAKSVIEQAHCGVVVPFGDSEGMAAAITNCYMNRDEWLRFGQNGKSYFIQKFSRKAFMDSLEIILEEETLKHKNEMRMQ